MEFNGVSIDLPLSEMNKIQRYLQQSLEKEQESLSDKVRNAAEFMVGKIKEAYASPSGKIALSNTTIELRQKYGNGGNIPLFHTGTLMNSVIAVPDKNNKSETSWKVTLTPGKRAAPSPFGGGRLAVQQVATIHEEGLAKNYMPNGTKRAGIPPRPIWQKTFDRYANEAAKIMSLGNYTLTGGG